MHALKFLFNNIDQFKSRFILVYLAGMLDGLATFLIPVALAEFTKNDFNTADFRQLIYLIIGLYVASLCLQWVIRRWGESLASQFGNHLRLKYFCFLKNLSLEDLNQRHSGYLLSLINKVSDGYGPIIFDLFYTFAKGVINVILFFFFTARESLLIAVLNLVVLAIFISISTVLSGKMVKIADQLNRKKASLLESYADFIANIFTIKRLGIFSFAESKISHKTEDNYQQIQKLQNFHAWRWLFLHTLFGIAFLSTIVFLLSQISRGNISASILVLFIAGYTLIRGNVERLSENFRSFFGNESLHQNVR